MLVEQVNSRSDLSDMLFSDELDLKPGRNEGRAGSPHSKLVSDYQKDRSTSPKRTKEKLRKVMGGKLPSLDTWARISIQVLHVKCFP